MAGYLGSRPVVVQVDGYQRTEAESRYVNVSGDDFTGHLDFTDDAKARFGSSDEMHIYTESSGSGYSYIQGDSIVLRKADQSTNYLTAIGGVVSLQPGGGNVGIGTSSPAQKLTVASEGRLRLYRSDNARYSDIYNDNNFLNIETSNDPIRLNGQSYIRFDVSSTERMRIDSSGNVGIGTTTSAGKLTVDGSVVSQSAAQGAGNVQLQGYGPTSYINHSGTGSLIFRMGTGYSEKLRLDASGNLGIGVTPTHKLHVNGTVKVTGTQTFDVDSGGGSYIAVNHTGNESWTWDARSGSGSDDYLDVGISGGTRAMSWHETGRVGIGTTAPSQLLTVEGSSFPIIQISNTDANNPANAVALDLVEKQTGYAAATATFGQGGVYGYRLKLDGSSNNLILQSGSQTTVTDIITIERDTGNLGIGTASPAEKLHVEGSSPSIKIKANNEGGSAELKLQSDQGDDNQDLWSIKADPAHALDFINYVSGAWNTRMRIDSSGNVGIGITNPAQLLHVQAGSTGNGTIRVGGGAGLEISHNNSGATVQRIDSLYRTTSASTNLQLRTGILTLHTGASSTERMRIDSSGRVGIANDTPGDFNASGDDLVIGNSSGNRGITIRSGTSNSGNLFFADGLSGTELYRGFIQYQHADDRLVLGAGGDDRVWISSSGNVGIGTSDPDCMLHLSGGNEEAKIKFQVGTANADKFKIYASTAGRLYVNSDNGSTGVYLTHNGTSWTGNSDETLKENITSLGTVGDKLKNYRTSYFTWKADTETPPKRNIGFIAQDWETDFPEVLTKKEGEPMGMQYTETIPILLKYIQELEARITALEA